MTNKNLSHSDNILRDKEMKTFLEFYEEKYGDYPGYSNEPLWVVHTKVFSATAKYMEYVKEELVKQIEEKLK